MANGINTTRSQKPKKEEITGSKELTPSFLPEDTLVKLLALGSADLRMVFDRAISEHNARMTEENTNHAGEIESLDNRIEENANLVTEHYQQIEELQQESSRLIVSKNEESIRHEGVVYRLEEGRVTIENLMQLFKPKLDGFND